MPFNIHELDNLDSYSEQAEGALEDYQDTLLEQFYNSPEGKQRLEDDPEMGFWVSQLIYYGFSYIGVTLPQMNVSNIREIVTEIFPRKITIESPDDADDTIPELKSFWQFLKKEYKLQNADDILSYLLKVEPEYDKIMNDPSKYGMAKSFMMSGKSAGFNMTNESDFSKFAFLHNASIASEINENTNENQEYSYKQNNKKTKNKKKKARKIAKTSRKKNKKRK